MGPDFAVLCDLGLVSGPQFPLPFSEGRCKRYASEQVPGGIGREGLIGPAVKGATEEGPASGHLGAQLRPRLRSPLTYLPEERARKEAPATTPRPLPRGPAPRDEIPPRARPSPRLASPAVQSWDCPSRLLDCPRPADAEPGLQGNPRALRLLGNKVPTDRLRPVMGMRHSRFAAKGGV